jgi:4-deoxy-L-threo-5-hexosulose-uronate ketol-isomerase
MTKTLYAIHPEDFKSYDTAKIRANFLLEEIFIKGEITCTYTMYDRLIVGGIAPDKSPLKLETIDQLKSEYFLERREIGIINVGAATDIQVDGTTYRLNYKEALYIGRECKEVLFHPAKDGQTLLYYNSAPAHKKYPSRKVALNEADTAVMGSHETANHRTIRKLLVNSVLPTCQLQMGLTELQPGSVWNTMPPHTHDRRMEAYFYFELGADQAVCHFMGTPNETRHIWMKNNQAVISPPWSIHSGAATSNYSFIWGMAGENLDYSDMDTVKPTILR